MSHHYGPELSKIPMSAFSNPELGSTGRFPNGKLNNEDQGEIKIGVTISEEKVILAFGKPVEWIGFTREQAIQIGQTLIDRARQV